MIPFAPSVETKAALIVAAVCLVGGFASGYRVADWRLTAKVNAEEVQRTRAALQALATMTADRDRLAGKLADANDKHAQELRIAQDETNRLRDRLSAGAIGLRIAAKCPAVTAPAQSTPGARVDSGAGAELDTPARQAYFTLRDGINQVESKLAACQDELRLRTAEGGNKAP